MCVCVCVNEGGKDTGDRENKVTIHASFHSSFFFNLEKNGKISAE